MKSKIIKSNGAFQFQVDDQIIDASAFKSFRPTNKKIKESTIFYSALGNLSYQALQYVLNYSKVHIYTKEGFATFACTNFIGIYAPNVNEISLNFKENGTYKEIFTNEIYEVKDKRVTLSTSINCARMLEKIK